MEIIAEILIQMLLEALMHVLGAICQGALGAAGKARAAWLQERKAYKEEQIRLAVEPKTSLLRASQHDTSAPTELVRAAMPSEETASEELLRPQM